ncbi:hypothetical protein [Draconibacterium orientale]|uniref:hypothetical protein n=1 Tax=Draconibacterium orientale TaxID=1168034 RepID=UPI002ABE0CD0|nr:hypothetical protein [Draconibacterium orientale]
MVTKTQYRQAKEKIEHAKKQIDKMKNLIQETEKITHAYEEQEQKLKNERLLKLRKNDYVEYIGGTKSKQLTVGKKYRLTCKSFNGRIALINDSGRRIVIWPKYFNF